MSNAASCRRIIRRDAAAAAPSLVMSMDARHAAADRAGAGRIARGAGQCAGAAPSGAAGRSRPAAPARPPPAPGAVVAAAQGPGHGASARRRRGRGAPARHAARVRRDHAVRRPTSPRSTTTSTGCWWRVRSNCWTPSRRAGDRLVLRPGQLHAADRHPGARGAGIEGSEALVQRSRENAIVNRRDNATFAARNLFELSAQDPPPTARLARWLVDPPREGAFALGQGAGRVRQNPIAGYEPPAPHRLRCPQPLDAGARRRAADAPGRLPLCRRGRGQHVPAHRACRVDRGVRAHRRLDAAGAGRCRRRAWRPKAPRPRQPIRHEMRGGGRGAGLRPAAPASADAAACRPAHTSSSGAPSAPRRRLQSSAARTSAAAMPRPSSARGTPVWCMSIGSPLRW